MEVLVMSRVRAVRTTTDGVGYVHPKDVILHERVMFCAPGCSKSSQRPQVRAVGRVTNACIRVGHVNRTPWSRTPHKRGIFCACCRREVEVNEGKKKNYYELLGVTTDSSAQEIKEAYRKLQKIYHPDIAGQKGHEYTLVLNKAYKVLMTDDLRRDYDLSIGRISNVGYGKGSSLSGYSSWKGPLRPQALFVDENSCIGCRECVHHAENTFVMDENLARARVKVQYGDDDTKIQVSVESCPLNCIHWVDSEELRVLEHLSRPQRKDGHGIYGQGWESPRNVFMAAKSFHKQLKNQAEDHVKNGGSSTEEETPGQAEARLNASMKLRMKSFSRIWRWMKEVVGQ